MSDTKNLYAALAKAQGQIQAAQKSSENPAFSRGEKKSKYADIAEVIEVIQKPASENGLSVIFNYHLNEEVLFINYILMHSSGETLTGSSVPMFLRDKTMHGFGASNTFMRRQLLKAIYQVPEEDDDGNSQSVPTPAPQKPLNKPEVKNLAPKPPPPPKEEKYNPESFFEGDDSQPEPDEPFESLKPIEQILVLKHKIGLSNDQMSEIVKRVTGCGSTKDCDPEQISAIRDYLKMKLK